jgi:hypothetical protein
MQKIGAWLFSLVILASGAVSCTHPPKPLVMQAPLSEEVTVQALGLQDVTVQTLCLEIEQYPDEYSGLMIPFKSCHPKSDKVVSLATRPR